MKKEAAYILAVICLVLSVIAVIIYDTHAFRRRQINYIHSFQKTIGGLGIGAVAKPSWCYINYDPRIEGVCSCIEWPVPGGYCFCPDHTGSVVYMEESP
ncbi:MAG: hypothetical protein HZA06_02535 [Nitrospirae bacterium]|nr:hypothetical protein [Nitrospirota bacterium]